MSSIKTVGKKIIIWNYIGTLFNMCISFLMLPFLLRYLETEILGLWYVMNSLGNISSLFSFGFTPSFARNVSYCWCGAEKLEKEAKSETVNDGKEINYGLLKQILVTSKYVYLLLSVICLFFLAIFGSVHIYHVAGAVLTNEIWIAWIVFLLAVFLNLYYSYYGSYLIGIGRVKESSQILVISGIIRIIFMVTTLHMGMGLLGVALSYLFYGLCYRTLSKWIFLNTENLKGSLRRVPRIHFSEMKKCLEIVWHNAWRDGVVSIAAYLATQMSTLVCSSFLTLAETAVYALTVQLVDSIAKLSMSICNAHTAVLQRAYVMDDKQTGREMQSFCIVGIVGVYLCGIIALETVGIPLIAWMKPEAALNRYVIAGYGAYQFLLSIRDCYGRYLSCTNRVIYWKAYLASGMGSVLVYTLALYFINCGIWGIVVISILAESLYNVWKWPCIVNRELGLHWRDIFILGTKRFRRLIGIERDS